MNYIFKHLAIITLFVASCTIQGNNESKNTNLNAQGTDSLIIADKDDKSTKFKLMSESPYYWIDRGSSELYLMAKVTGGEDLEQKKRTPLNISLVIDRSGSMSSENKLEKVKKACNLVIKNLTKEDKLSIVAYDDYVKVVQSSDFIEKKAVLEQKVNNILTGGSTNLSGGMLEGFAQVLETYEGKAVNRVLLLSDGLANRGITEVSKLQEIVQSKYTEDNIALSTFGVGTDFNEDLMTNLAEYGRGNYYFINSPDEIPEIFKQELDGLLSVVAQNAVLELHFPEELVEIEKVYDYGHKIEGNKVTVDFNDVFAKEDKIVLLKFKIKDLSAVETLAFKASFTYDDVLSDYKRMTKQQALSIALTSDQAKYEAHLNKEVQRNIIISTSVEQFDLVTKKIDEGKYDQARTMMQQNMHYMENNDMIDIKSDSILFEQYESYKNYADEIENIEEIEVAERNRVQKANKSMNYKLGKRKK